MNMKNNDEHIFSYKLINWSKPAPILKEKTVGLTKTEARFLNNAFGLNFEAKRYIKTGEDEIDHEFMIHGSFPS
jgi:hypothetical protein